MSIAFLPEAITPIGSEAQWLPDSRRPGPEWWVVSWYCFRDLTWSLFTASLKFMTRVVGTVVREGVCARVGSHSRFSDEEADGSRGRGAVVDAGSLCSGDVVFHRCW